MGFLSGFFSCCEPNRKALEAEAETRKARIVSVYNNSYNRSLCSVEVGRNSMPPPRYSDIAQDPTVMVATEVKTRDVYDIEEEPAETIPPRSSSPVRTISDTSSVISIPSTRLSGLTSTYTGGTARVQQRGNAPTAGSNRSSWRDSGIYSDFGGSAPPSYYAGSESDNDSDSGAYETHPVMADGWMERLRHEAETRLDRQDAQDS